MTLLKEPLQTTVDGLTNYEDTNWGDLLFINKPRHNWVGNVIHWGLCKKLKFDHTNKWYLNFDLQTDHLISARRSDRVIDNKTENRQSAE